MPIEWGNCYWKLQIKICNTKKQHAYRFFTRSIIHSLYLAHLNMYSMVIIACSSSIIYDILTSIYSPDSRQKHLFCSLWTPLSSALSSNKNFTASKPCTGSTLPTRFCWLFVRSSGWHEKISVNLISRKTKPTWFNYQGKNPKIKTNILK